PPPPPPCDGGAPSDDGGGGGGPPTGNPFSGAELYLNPDYVAEVESSVAKHPADTALLKKGETISTAIWLDSIAKVASVNGYLDDARNRQNSANKPVVTVFVIYDLPNRDCAAQASNGELSVDNGGVQKYKTDYIDKIADAFAAHASQRIVAI